jgi:oligo-1,6-glucosidase
MHEYAKEMRQEVFGKYDCMTVGELGFTKDEHSISEYVAKDRHELNMVFAGDIVDVDFGTEGKYGHNDFKLSRLREITQAWQTAMPKFDGWNAVYMDNHDSGRSLSRTSPTQRNSGENACYISWEFERDVVFVAGTGDWDGECAERVGIENYVDVEGRNAYFEIARQRGEGAEMGDVVTELRLKARDNGRMAMQWDGVQECEVHEEGAGADKNK